MFTGRKNPNISEVPWLYSLWDHERNVGLGRDPEKLSAGSGSTAWWFCNNGHDHSFKQVIADRLRGFNCSVCRGYQVWRGFNDFESWYPDQAKRWNYLFNDKKPWEITKAANKKYWFICDEGHHFSIRLLHIHRSDNWCHYCTGKQVWPGDNDLATTHPRLASQIDPESGVDPSMVSYGSKIEPGWICPGNPEHRWTARIHSRAVLGSGCPEHYPQRSKAEIAIFNWIASELVPGIEVIPNDRTVFGGKHIDIWIPSLRVGIEYNGNYWHKDKEDRKDATQWKIERARELGITLIVIWEDDWKVDQEYWEDVILVHLRGAIYDTTLPAYG